MAEIVKDGASASVSRRGLGSARGVARLKFNETDVNKQTGLFEAHLDSVDITTIKIGENTTGMPSFNGLEIPRIKFNFASNNKIESKRKYITIAFNAVESNMNTIPGGKEEWKVNQVLDYIKHILNVYVLKGRNLTDDEIQSFSLPFEDFNENGEYIPVEPEVVIEGWKAFFSNIENVLNRGNNGGKSYFNNGQFIPVWIKLIRCTKSKTKGWINVNNGDLSFPTFVGEGAIEIIIPNSYPAIHLDLVHESITPKVVEKPKQPNMPNNGIMTMGNMTGGIIDNGYTGMESNSGLDTPFTTEIDMPDLIDQ